MLRNKIENYLFHQPNIDFRIFVARLAISLITVSYVLVGPFDQFHVDAADLLYRPAGMFSFIPKLGGWSFYFFKYAVIVSGISFALGFKTRLSNVVFAFTYFVFAYYVGHFSTQLFSYITHLNLFLIILCFVRAERFWSLDWVLAPERKAEPYPLARQEFASFALAFMQLFVIAFYVQAGVSKLLFGGVEWFTTGATAYYGAIVAGTKMGLWMSQFPWLFKGVGMFTGLFELGFFLILWRKIRPLYALSVIAFHFGILLNINIYFYQLSGLVPLLFVFEDTRNYRRALAGLGVYFVLLGGLMAMTPLSAEPLAHQMPARGTAAPSAPAGVPTVRASE